MHPVDYYILYIHTYIKELIWRPCKQLSLSASVSNRIKQVGLKMLFKHSNVLSYNFRNIISGCCILSRLHNYNANKLHHFISESGLTDDLKLHTQKQKTKKDGQ